MTIKFPCNFFIYFTEDIISKAKTILNKFNLFTSLPLQTNKNIFLQINKSSWYSKALNFYLLIALLRFLNPLIWVI